MPQERPPAKMAPACAMNHSGALKPRMPTEWCLSRPSLMKALAMVRESEWYCLYDHFSHSPPRFTARAVLSG